MEAAGFHSCRGANKIFTFVGCNAAFICSCLLTFRDNLFGSGFKGCLTLEDPTDMQFIIIHISKKDSRVCGAQLLCSNGCSFVCAMKLCDRVM
jgi:hypothetical protein